MVRISTLCLKNGENKDNRRACLQAMIAVYLVLQQHHGRFYAPGFYSIQNCHLKEITYFELKTAHEAHRRDVTHILCKVSCILLKSFHFRRLRKQ